MRPRSPNLLIFCVTFVIVAIVGACAGSTASPATPARTGVDKAASPAPSPRFCSSPDVPAAGDLPGILLVGRSGSSDLELVVANTGESVMHLPAGAMDSAWGRLVTAKADTVGTIVRDVAAEDSSSGPVLDVKGRWRLPTIGSDRAPVGVSADGSTFVLVSADPPATTSRFAVVQHVDGTDPTRTRTAPLRLTKVIELPGSFEFDAVSPDGSILYVAQHLESPPGAYQVRAVDVTTGKLRDGVIVDKRNVDETMAGWPVGQMRRPDGVVLTLYRGAEHPFIHALNTIDAWAVCIDLPSAGASDTAAAADWGIAADPAGGSVYAVNATLGVAAEINATELTLKRSALLRTASTGGSTGGPSIVLAKFGHDEVGAAGRVVVAPDGKSVWATGANGLVAIATRDLSVSRRMLGGTAVDGVAIAPDGSTVYALLRSGGRIVALDAASGRTLGNVPGDGFDRLMAAAPW
jgi:DNA-binding beta-propeller fold protein YncE